MSATGEFRQIEFWFEFASTYSYPAAARIEELATARGVNIAWRPFVLGPIFKAQGWHDTPFNIYPAKGRYMWRDMERTCANLGLPMNKPSAFPRNGLLAARVAASHLDAAWLPAFVRGVYQANFARDEDIASPAVLEAILDQLSLDGDAILADAISTEGKGRLRSLTEEAVEKGIFGAPTFVADKEMFWGNDRLIDAINWAAGDRSSPVPVDVPVATPAYSKR